MFDIAKLAAIAADRRNIEVTVHAFLQMKKREISIVDIYNGFENGEIIEQYPDDYPFPSCLILCFTTENKPLHFVCSMANNKIYIITAYFPNSEQWENDYRTRKKVLQ